MISKLLTQLVPRHVFIKWVCSLTLFRVNVFLNVMTVFHTILLDFFNVFDVNYDSFPLATVHFGKRSAFISTSNSTYHDFYLLDQSYQNCLSYINVFVIFVKQLLYGAGTSAKSEHQLKW